VSLPVVQVGGGLVVVSIGWGILLEKDDAPETARHNVTCSDPLHNAFYPLTLPLTVGPGSISVAITLEQTRPAITDSTQLSLLPRSWR
jgi:multiple antibiotic resistance protein